jgi:hypothetical protein
MLELISSPVKNNNTPLPRVTSGELEIGSVYFLIIPVLNGNFSILCAILASSLQYFFGYLNVMSFISHRFSHSLKRINLIIYYIYASV